jgi:hypothetical protein
MKIKLSELRKIIREEVERNLRWSAGYFGGDLSSPQKGINYVPLQGLGSSTEEEKKQIENYEEEEELERDITD